MNNKEFKIVVLAKQVPDTHNVGKDAMKEDGTINRAALPAIFNPDDLKALEMALACKDALKDLMPVTVTVITMGPSRAADIIRESMFRGADNGIVVSDKRFAGSDTLATSYALSAAVKKLGDHSSYLLIRLAIVAIIVAKEAVDVPILKISGKERPFLLGFVGTMISQPGCIKSLPPPLARAIVPFI